MSAEELADAKRTRAFRDAPPATDVCPQPDAAVRATAARAPGRSIAARCPATARRREAA
ncbi:MAG: hypothetical protein U5K43_10530 [Halofilum sp. (in: g-proteobacteria)]|nr:hypothetical protein [Halofilum sp. (in: g-proteobacteria)]